MSAKKNGQCPTLSEFDTGVKNETIRGVPVTVMSLMQKNGEGNMKNSGVQPPLWFNYLGQAR
jgi:hypothetical protein